MRKSTSKWQRRAARYAALAANNADAAAEFRRRFRRQGKMSAAIERAK